MSPQALRSLAIAGRDLAPLAPVESLFPCQTRVVRHNRPRRPLLRGAPVASSGHVRVTRRITGKDPQRESRMGAQDDFGLWERELDESGEPSGDRAALVATAAVATCCVLLITL